MSEALKFDPERGIVWRGTERLTIEPKGIDVLRLLAREPGTVVTAEQLQKRVWRRRHLGEGVISQTLYKLRRALADDGLIQSVRGEGWRLTRPITICSADAVPDPPFDPVTTAPPRVIEAKSSEAATVSTNPPPANRVSEPPKPLRAWWSPQLATLYLAPLIVVLLGAAYWLRASSGMDQPSLAVMPFVDVSGDQRLAALAASLRARIALDVHGVPRVRVSSEDAIARFRGDMDNAGQVWSAMAANVVIRGDLAPSSDHPDGFVLTLRIVDFSGHDLNWSKQYVHASGDSAPLLERVRLDLYQHLEQHKYSDHTRAQGTQHAGAHAAFLRAVTLAAGNAPDDYRRALASLELAVELDPTYAEAWSELGGFLGGRQFVPDNADELKRSRARSIAAMDRAIALSPEYVDAILMRSEIRHNYAFDWDGAAADVARAEQIVGGPRVDVLLQKARLTASLGHLDTAIRLNDEAHAKEPLSGARRNAGWHLLSLGRYAQARSYLLEEHKIRPWESSLNYYLGLCDLFEGHPEDALKRFGYADSDYRLTGLAMANFDLGHREEAEQALGTLITRSPDQSAYEIATVYGHIGNADEAFLWLDHAIEVRDGGLEYLAFDPRLRKLRDDPRMAERLRQIKHPKWLVSGAK